MGNGSLSAGMPLAGRCQAPAFRAIHHTWLDETHCCFIPDFELTIGCGPNAPRRRSILLSNRGLVTTSAMEFAA
jgi:hypothetical protein